MHNDTSPGPSNMVAVSFEPPPTDPQTGKPIKDTIKIVYHPKSKRKTKYKSFHDYQHKSHTTQHIPDPLPWLPFCTRANFEYAKIALQGGLNSKQNNALIALICRIASGKEKFNLKDNTNLKDCWKSASTKLTTVSVFTAISCLC